ncbi:unnamed protein product [Peronospora farinosa]|uniref:Uncharacterized protein n=1 Tax=Peronospora farinosa TaxID=134698 RepID=A0AAV0UVT4_9STRA|nr:unnamed protein product [Peronospora farinosa]CAI5740378.1 unnamed protein product [Peronospora farinosa]
MERFGGGLKKGGGAAVATFKPGVISAKGKFKLCTSRDPLPLVTKKQACRETKPKAKFLTVAGAGASTETQNNAKRSIIATNSFIQPLTKDGAPPRKSSGVNFMKFQSKPRDSGESTGKSSMNATPLAQTGMKPFVGKLFAQPFSKKIICTTRNANKETLLKPHEKKEELFSFRADTKSSVAKKRKATDSIAQRDGKTAFSCKNERGKSSLLENPVTNKDKEKQAGVQAENAGRKDSIRSTVPFAIRMGERSKKVDDGAVLKKRGLLVASTIAGPPLKKSKRVPPSVDTCQSDRDHNVSLPSTCMLNPKETALEFADEPANSVLPCAEAPLSPGKW